MGTGKLLKRCWTGTLLCGLVSVFLLLAAPPAFAGAGDFFRGKTLTYIVTTKPGGGYDFYARLIGKYLEKYLRCTVVVRNVPGAGHIVGANELYVAKPDGLTIGTFSTGLIYAQLAGLPGLRFDLRKFTWIGKAAADTRVLGVNRSLPYNTFEELRHASKPVYIAVQGAGSANTNETMMLNKAFGLHLKLVYGYSSKQAQLAMLRGEVDGQLISYSVFEPFLKAGKGKILLQIAGKKHPDLPDVPLASDIVPPKGKYLVRLMTVVLDLMRLTAAPPGVPEARTRVLIAAYKKALDDPGLRAEAARADIPIDPAFGRDVGKMVAEALDQPPENIALLKMILTSRKKKK